MPTVLQPTDEDTLFRVITCLANEGYNVNNVLQTNKAFWWDEQIWDAMKNKCGPNGITPLMYNIWRGRVKRVAWLLKRSPNLEAQTKGGETALSIACDRGNVKIISMLLEKGAKIISTDKFSNLVNIISTSVANSHVYKGASKEYATAVKKLLEYGADLNEVRGGESAIGSAISHGTLGIVKILCDAGADLEVKDSKEFTPLMRACSERSFDKAKELIKYGANVNALSNSKWWGVTPLSIAASVGDRSIVRELCKAGADVNFRNSNGDTAIFRACFDNNPYMVMELIRMGANVNVQNNNGVTPLFLAAEDGCLQIVKSLYYAGADMNATFMGQTPLISAVVNGHVEVVEFLSERADHESLNEAMHSACRCQEIEVMKFLLNKVDVKQYKEYTVTGNEEMKVLLNSFM
jgi:ankyrin repeat protein